MSDVFETETDVTLADEDNNSIPTDDVNRAIDIYQLVCQFCLISNQIVGVLVA